MDFANILANYASKKFAGALVAIACITYLAKDSPYILAGIIAIAAIAVVYVFAVARWSDNSKK
jgi:hypothetical protein